MEVCVIQELFSKRSLTKLIIPLIIEQILASTIGMADTVMVASLGEAAVSGVSLVDSLNLLIIQIFAALATGGAVITAQYLGRGDNDNADKSAKQLIVISFIMAAFLTVISVFFNRLILSAIFGSIEESVMQNSISYFYMTAFSFPFFALFNACAVLFRVMNNSRVPMFVSFTMNIINIIGNAFFIYILKIGVTGAGLASLISRITGAAIMIFLISRIGHEITVKQLYRPEFNFKIIKGILSIGIPNGLEGGMFQIGKLLIQTLVSSFGTAVIAANAISSTVAGFACIPGSAIGLAMITVVGRCVGAGEHGQAIQYTRRLMSLNYILMTVTSLVFFIMARVIVGAFNISETASETAVMLLHMYFIFCPFIWPTSFTLPNALRAAGDVRFTMVVSMVSMWTYRIGFSYILSGYLQMGILGVWVAMILDWIVRSICFIWRFRSNRWTRIKVI
ncbi:MAG: MATE family efflux transporter [Eubacteriales bacterium]